MNIKIKKIESVLFAALLILVTNTGCMAKRPPVAENFIFTPPSSAAATKSGMSIAILKPEKAGNYFLPATPVPASSDPTMEHMLEAVQTDTEKSLIAKGFTTTGKYISADEMTFSQKENSQMLFKQKITVNIAVAGSQATVSGNAVLELLESFSRSKLWIKHLELTPVTNNVDFVYGNRQTPQGQQLVKVVSPNSVTELLNAFYSQTMQKIWDQLDAKEIENLKSDLNKIKPKTQFQSR